MIDIKLYEKDSNFQKGYLESLKMRGEDSSLIKQAVSLNESRKKSVFKIDQLIVERKKTESFLRKTQNNDEKEVYLKKASSIGEEISLKQKQLRELEQEISNILIKLPNVCHASVPKGKTNEVLKKEGEKKIFSFKPRSHLELALSKIDTERAAKVSGARFSFLRDSVARLERVLSQYMLDKHTKQNGYEEIHAPFLVSESSLIHTGQLPKFKEDVFHVSNYGEKGGYLIPTAEVPVTNFYSNEILSEKDLPAKFTAYTPCFRSEAGAYGKDTKGLIRQHQFTKVELVIFSHPEKSYEELEKLVSHAEGILKDLELSYQKVNLCAEDLGFGAAKCYDLEVWLPSSSQYREISSCSNYEDYQARRGNIRFKSSLQGKPKYLHTLNGSGLAVGRTLIAVLENYQNEDGSVRVPQVLKPYMDGKTLL